MRITVIRCIHDIMMRISCHQHHQYLVRKSSKNPLDDVSQMHIVTLDAPCSVCGSMVTLRVQSEREAQRLVGLLLCPGCAVGVQFHSLPRCTDPGAYGLPDAFSFALQATTTRFYPLNPCPHTLNQSKRVLDPVAPQYGPCHAASNGGRP